MDIKNVLICGGLAATGYMIADASRKTKWKIAATAMLAALGYGVYKCLEEPRLNPDPRKMTHEEYNDYMLDAYNDTDEI